MIEDYIVCPKCLSQIQLSQAIKDKVKLVVEKEYIQKIKELESEKKLIEERSRELIEKEKSRLEKFFESRVAEEAEKKLRMYQQQIDKLTKILEEYHNKELVYLKEKQKLEEEKRNLEFKYLDKFNKEKEDLITKLQQEIDQKYKIQLLEYEKKISEMQKSLEDAQSKANVFSDRLRGEVSEIDVFNQLKQKFLSDSIEEVPKGISGADIIQVVANDFGDKVGKIVWEVKRTKLFNSAWIDKLKDDLIKVNGNLGVIITQSLPEDIKNFGNKDGVWICDFAHFVPLAIVLRQQLFEMYRIKKMIQDKSSKMNELYQYIISDQFKNKIIRILETYENMHQNLEKEKRAYTRIWAERQKQIQSMIENTVSLLGDMQGIIGQKLPSIRGFELPSLEEDKLKDKLKDF